MPTRLLSALALAAIWEAAARLAGNRMLPTIEAVAHALWQEAVSGRLGSNLAITLVRVAAAFVIAMVVGTVLGIAMGRAPALDRWLDAPATMLLNLPALVVIVLIYIWFGLGEWQLIAAVALTKLPSTIVTMREGARALDPGLDAMARSCQVSRWSMIRDVILPQLAPFLFAATRSGLALIWKIVLVAELLGRSNGVGFQIQVQFQLFDIAGILAYTVAFIIVVQMLEWCCLQPLEHYVGAWRG